VDVGRDIHELAESIKKIGLLEPIIICLSEEEGKYEIIAGQRRYLAHKEIGVETIKAIVIEDKLDELDAKIISLTENWNRRDLSSKDERDACLILWRRYNNVDLIIEDTGLPASKVRKYLRFNSLVAPLKALVDRDEVTLEAAYTAQKALEVTGDVDEEEVVGVAKELQGMSTPQRKKVTKKRKESPEKPMGAIIEEAKSGEKLIQVAVTLGEASHKGLQKYAQSEGTNQNSACGELIEEGLVNKGFLESE
jgi:ParB family chromosome partitioning protein